MKNSLKCGAVPSPTIRFSDATLSDCELYSALENEAFDAEGASFMGKLVITSKVKLSNLNISGDLVIEASAAGTLVSDCTVSGSIKNLADESAFIRVKASSLTDESDNALYIANCIFSAADISVSSCADNAEIRSSNLSGDIVLGNAENALIALTVCDAIHASGMKNTAIVKNSVKNLSAADNHALYIIENEVSGLLSLSNNNYIIADLNKCGEVISEDNENKNGDNITDIHARLPKGADPALLPHIDKELFVGMRRKEKLRIPDCETEPSLPEYINSRAKTDDIIIIAPGAYFADELMAFDKDSSNTVIYAYGVYAERQEDLYQRFDFKHAESITIKGMYVAFKQQSCGQVYVVEKGELTESGERGWVKVISGAGLIDDFAATGTKYFQSAGGAHHDFYAYCDTNYADTTKTALDGTRCLTLQRHAYDTIRVGDVLNCRAANGSSTFYITDCADISFHDLTLYGNAGGFAWTESNNRTATRYYRICDTTRTGEVIDEETYSRYRGYEKKYGISFDLSIDELGRFRGSPCRIGSVDATHTMRCGQGSVISCSLFENMCDDGTNQNHTHSRLASISDNGDGTSTVVYKGLLPMFFYRSLGSRKCNNYCSPFKKGQRVYIYTSGGQLVCDTPALSDGISLGMRTAQEYGTEYEAFSLTVATDAVNFKALDGYDLSKNTPEDGPGEKVLVDNMSLASNGFDFDNVIIRNIRSRGLLIKASEGRIENCTFENIGMSCAAILYEIFWGESGVTENMLVKNNVFDHTGYFNPKQKYYAPISIHGLGSSADEDYLLYKNIRIEGNVIKNRTTDYAVYVNSAKNVTIKNNDFGSPAEGTDRFACDIFVEGAVNIDISGNKYSDREADIKSMIRAEHFKNILGSDVSKNRKTLFPDQDQV